MFDTCPLCERPLIIGQDGKQQIEYTEENLAKFKAGEITLEELNETAIIFYMRPRLCNNKGNNNLAIRDDVIYKYKDMDSDEALAMAISKSETKLLNPPCQNYYGIRGGTIENPDVVVEWIKIIDN